MNRVVFRNCRGQKALEDDKAIQLIPSKRMTAMATGMIYSHGGFPVLFC